MDNKIIKYRRDVEHTRRLMGAVITDGEDLLRDILTEHGDIDISMQDCKVCFDDTYSETKKEKYVSEVYLNENDEILLKTDEEDRFNDEILFQYLSFDEQVSVILSVIKVIE